MLRTHSTLGHGRALRTLALCLLLAAIPASSLASVLYVKSDAPGPTHNGASWTTAFTSIQPAINAAASGDEVWVAKGVYPGDVRMKTGVALYGGFAGTETARAQRDWMKNETVIDATTPNGSLVSALTFPADSDASTIVDGFTLTKGKGTQISDTTTSYVVGGGIYVIGGSPVIRNNRITANEALNIVNVYRTVLALSLIHI